MIPVLHHLMLLWSTTNPTKTEYSLEADEIPTWSAIAVPYFNSAKDVVVHIFF